MSNIIDCPNGCGRRVHVLASHCPGCGYRPELATLRDVLGSLSTVASILIGFGLASLVTLAVGDAALRTSWVGSLCAGVWTVASLLLLTVLVAGEALRRKEPESLIAPSYNESARFLRKFGILVRVFLFALALMAAGIISLGF